MIFWLISTVLVLPFSWLGFVSSGCEITVKLISAGIGLYFLRQYFAGGRCNSNARLDGKVAIITGANTGIGKETARDFIRRGAKVIIACRDTIKGEVTAAEIRSCATENGKAIVKQLDLASLKSVREFSEDILKTEPNIHLLINNAGIMMCPRWTTKDGFEMQLGTNHIGHFLLTNLLLERLKESAPARVVVVSSVAHEKGEINFSDINSNHSYGPFAAYRQSKLANVLFARELHRRLKGSNVSAFSLHPGVINTGIGQHLYTAHPWMEYPISLASPIVMKNAEQGAQTSIYCAVQEGIENLSGSYFSDCKVKEEAPQAKVDESAKRLWKLTEEMVGIN